VEAGDLLGGRANHESKRKRCPRLGVHRWMAAEQDQRQPLVAKRVKVILAGRCHPPAVDGQEPDLAAVDGLGPQPTDDQPQCGRVEPTSTVGWHSPGRPPIVSPGEGLAECILGEIEAAGTSHEH
jgi:hypothetical protein